MKLGFEVWGNGGIPLVALHGFTGNRNSWDHLRPHWSAHLRVLAIDLPGHGESVAPAELSFDETVEGLFELIAREGFTRGNLLGYSLGGRLSLGIAMAHPESFFKLILESASPGLKRRRARGERRRADERLAEDLLTRGVSDFIQNWEALPLFGGLRALPKERQSDLRQRRLSSNAEGLATSLRTLGVGAQPNFWPNLPGLRVPTLLVTGGRDPKFTTIAKEMGAELPMAWRRTFPTAGHVPHLEVSDEYASELLTFLQTPWAEEPWVELEAGSAP